MTDRFVFEIIFSFLISQKEIDISGHFAGQRTFPAELAHSHLRLSINWRQFNQEKWKHFTILMLFKILDDHPD